MRLLRRIVPLAAIGIGGALACGGDSTGPKAASVTEEASDRGGLRSRGVPTTGEGPTNANRGEGYDPTKQSHGASVIWARRGRVPRRLESSRTARAPRAPAPPDSSRDRAPAWPANRARSAAPPPWRAHPRAGAGS